jgi:hypothetical protein
MFGARVGIGGSQLMLRNMELTKTAKRLLLAATLVLSLLPAWGQEGAARVLSMTGRVDVLRDNTRWMLNAGSVVQPRQVVVTGPDGMARFEVLSDGSTFDVFPNSQVVFRASPANWKDLLDVTLGRVKVYIQKLNGQPNHNRVTTPTAVISVRGTVFDVAIEDEDATTLVSVEEGEVGVRNLAAGGEVSLHPGEWIRVYRSQPLAQRNVDRAAVVQGTLRAAAQALYELLYRRQVGGVGGSSGGGVPTTVGSGDHTKTGTDGTTTTAPPAPPPAPPAAPPPPPGN